MSSFRTEIAGLRALAVSIVVLFHLKIGAFGGGFVGVDVFFVISGYLITHNILRDTAASRFSFAQFYARRARRILPALIFTVFVTYLIGALWAAPVLFHDIAKECTHALLSIANIQYWRESHQYFATNSDELALLHCWSLSVEEQFYLFWPVFIILAHKAAKPAMGILIATIASLVAAVIVAGVDNSAVFFLTPFRVYEFGCGALVLFVEQRRMGTLTRELLSAGGVLAIVVSAIALRSDMPHLELAMLIPCLGAAATILAGGKTAVGKFISKPIAVGLGTISYSLYLCHWPIIFYARFIFGDAAASTGGLVVVSGVMLAVAIGMYFLVERPFIQSPKYRTMSFKKTALSFWSIILAMAALTHATFESGGFEWRPSSGKELAHLQSYPSAEDIVPVKGPVAFQLAGDSHAIQYQAGLSTLRQRLGINMEVLAGSSCPLLYGVSLKAKFRRKECVEIRDKALERIEQTNLPVIFDQFWSFYDDSHIEYQGENSQSTSGQVAGSHIKLERALEETMGRFARAGKRVLLIGAQVDANCAFNRSRLLQGPLPHVAPSPCPSGTKETAEAAGAEMNAMLARVQARWPDHIELLRPVDYFCDPRCETMNDGLWLYFDRTHFTVAGSYFMVKRIDARLAEFIQR
jgi:peptidoglycan/LPS O-acetylase OafA/YrhL